MSLIVKLQRSKYLTIKKKHNITLIIIDRFTKYFYIKLLKKKYIAEV